MEYLLSNDYLQVAFKRNGGALCSIKDAQGLEYLWQGDALLEWASTSALSNLW